MGRAGKFKKEVWDEKELAKRGINVKKINLARDNKIPLYCTGLCALVPNQDGYCSAEARIFLNLKSDMLERVRKHEDEHIGMP